MSLTRSEWLQVWAAIKWLEADVKDLCKCSTCQQQRDEAISTIKTKIQQVVGQLE